MLSNVIQMNKNKQTIINNWHPFMGKDNYNVCIASSANSGKASIVQDLIITTLKLDGYVFVLDECRDFEKTCRLFKGNYIDFDSNGDIAVDPFGNIYENKSKYYSKDEYNLYLADIFAFLAEIIGTIVSPNSKLSNIQTIKIYMAIYACWQQYKKEITFNKIIEHLQTKLQDDISLDLATQLSKELTANYDGDVTEKFNIDLTNQLTVVELANLESQSKHLIQKMAIIQIINQIMAYGYKKPFNIIINNADELLKDQLVAKNLLILTDKITKYNGSLVLIARSVKAFMVNQQSRKIFESAAWQYLLGQDLESITATKFLNRLSWLKDFTMDVNDNEICLKLENKFLLGDFEYKSNKI